jgi:primosomal protein N' (replication factor Y)
LVQTYNPEHPSIAMAAAHVYQNFATLEMTHREAHGYPPFHRMVRIIVRSRDAHAGAAFADKLGRAMQNGMAALDSDHRGAGIRVLGPAEAPVFRLKGYYRHHFQLHSASAALLHELLRAVLADVRAPTGVEFTVDVDPLNML